MLVYKEKKNDLVQNKISWVRTTILQLYKNYLSVKIETGMRRVKQGRREVGPGEERQRERQEPVFADRNWPCLDTEFF